MGIDKPWTDGDATAQKRTQATEQGAARKIGVFGELTTGRRVSGACQKKLGDRTVGHAGIVQRHGTGYLTNASND